MTQMQRWEPVGDDWNYMSDETMSLRVKRNGATLVATDYAVYGAPIPLVNNHNLPDNIRVCALVPAAEVGVPSEVVEAMKVVAILLVDQADDVWLRHDENEYHALGWNYRQAANDIRAWLTQMKGE